MEPLHSMTRIVHSGFSDISFDNFDIFPSESVNFYMEDIHID